MKKTLYLASQSPRRRDLLRQIDVAFSPLPVDIDETAGTDEDAADYVCRLAREKAEAGWRQVVSESCAVLGADTAVVIDGEILGKPADRDRAAAMLARLSGREHHVMSAVCLIDAGGADTVLSISTVRFADLTEADISHYLASGEADDKAGAYAIQGRGAVFVEQLNGSYSGVMGLPLHETARLFACHGLSVGLSAPSR